MEKQYKKRLKVLADFIEKVPQKRFNIKEWVTGEFCGKAQEPQHNDCGTAACVGGWACTITQFKRAGLSLHFAEDADNEEPVYDGERGIYALNQFFGLDEVRLPDNFARSDAGEYIFGDDNTNSPKDAARRIRTVLKVEELNEQLASVKE